MTSCSRTIAAEIIAPEQIVIRDAKTHCAILFEDNNRKPICRLFFNQQEKKAIMLFDGALEEKINIFSAQDLFTYRDRILNTIKKYVGGEL